MISISIKNELFTSLLNSVHYCDICPRMCGRNKVLSELNGPIDTKIMFIAEAPGRLGAECTRIPLCGDRTGDNFEMLLSNIGWSRSDIFITNAVLCNPQDDSGNNSTPTKEELSNCSLYLDMTINIVNPDIIVTLGVKALEALKNISPHKYILSKNVAQCLDWNNRKIYPLYHMGPRALIHRNMSKQCGDFIKLSHIIDPHKGLKNITSNFRTDKRAPSIVSGNNNIADVLLYIVNSEKLITMFKATKLMYLADLLALERIGSTITQSIYLRMQEGPWIPTLKGVSQQLEEQHRMKVTFKSNIPYYSCTAQNNIGPPLSSQYKAILDEIIEKYKSFDDKAIKQAAYLTAPMKYIRRQEKIGRQMTKVPVIYQNKTVVEIDKKLNIDESSTSSGNNDY